MPSTFIRLFRACFLPDTYAEISTADFLLCSSDGSKRDTIEGKAFDRILDPLRFQLEELNYSCASLALPFSELNGAKTWTQSLRCNRKFITAEAKKFFARGRSPRLEAYASLLQDIKPRVVIGVHLPPEICEAGRFLGIPVVEVLHGFGYGQFGWGNRTEFQLPAAVISFDALSSRAVRASTPSSIEVFELNLQDSIDSARAVLSESSTSETTDRPQVLYTIQWGYAGDDDSDANDIPFIENGIIPNSVLEAVSRTQSEVDWHFRLHPKQHAPEYAGIRRLLSEILSPYKNAEWETSSSTPLSLLLDRITHHISMCSMVAYEANSFGIPSLFLDERFLPENSWGSFQVELREIGALTIGNFSSGEILDWIFAEDVTHSNLASIEFGHELADVAEALLGERR